jgi:plastocyanin domain-containing protein
MIVYYVSSNDRYDIHFTTRSAGSWSTQDSQNMLIGYTYQNPSGGSLNNTTRPLISMSDSGLSFTNMRILNISVHYERDVNK